METFPSLPYLLVGNGVLQFDRIERYGETPRMNIDENHLNPLELQIHRMLSEYAARNDVVRIGQAAELCGCSISKISKFVQKLGFDGYKQYMQFLQGREMPQEKQSSELGRVRQYIDSFDESMVTELLALIESHNNIILFGYGPSFLCAQYFEYRLRIFSNKIIVALSDEISVASIADENTLLIILTVTGAFQSFQTVCTESKKKGCDVVIVAEEYNTNLFGQCDRIFWLSKFPQPQGLLPYEKTRTIFFLFFEELMQSILRQRTKISSPSAPKGSRKKDGSNKKRRLE